MEKKRNLFGVTLLEVMLVLAIVAMILLAAVRQYQVWRTDVQIQQVKANVNTLFFALANFYKANCAPAMQNNANTGLLAQQAMNVITPNATFPVTSTYPLNPFEDSLTGYSDLTLVPTALVEDGMNSNKGYLVQFNLTAHQRHVQTEGSISRLFAIVATWVAQVAVKLPQEIANNPSMAQAYLGLFGGDCLSSDMGGAGGVFPCNQAPADASDYVVWQRSPTLATSPDYWMVNPTVDQFTQEYQLYPGLYSVDNSIQTPPRSPMSQQIIFCGS